MGSNIPEIPEVNFPTLQVDPKDSQIEILLAYITDQRKMIDFLQRQVEFYQSKVGNVSTVGIPVPASKEKILTSGSLRLALERASAAKAEQERLAKLEAEKTNEAK